MTVWLTALIIIGFMNTSDEGFTFCLFKVAGFNWCPGCGLAHSIAYAIHGELYVSVKAHWFGIPALLIIMNRIIVLAKTNFSTPKSLYYGL